MRIKEVIVVEGKDDVQAVKKAVEADFIITNGLGITDDIVERIRVAQQRTGVIVLTDPDFPGEKIRNIVSKAVSGVKHAFIPKDKAIKKGDLGVENATPEAIVEALSKVRTLVDNKHDRFTNRDLINYGLIGADDAADLRDQVGRILGIGYTNGKQFLSRLNSYGITEEELITALNQVSAREDV